MKKVDVSVGKNYLARISGKLTHVRLLRVNPLGGWDGINLRTGRSVRIRTGAKLRKEIVAANAPINKNKIREDQSPTIGLAINNAFAALPTEYQQRAKEVYPEI